MKQVGIVALFGAAALFGHEYGPDPRYTAAPGDDKLACSTATCHTSAKSGGPLNPAGGAVTATFSSGTTYTPGAAITVTVTVSDPKNTHYGFQMTARLDSNQTTGQAGDFTAGTNQIVLCDNGALKGKSGCPTSAQVQFVEHSYPTGTHVGTTPYTFTWTAPATNVGPVHFYVAGNSVNNDLQADGNDHVYTASYVLNPAVVTPVTLSSVANAAGGTTAAGIQSGSFIAVKGTGFTSSNRIWQGSDFSGNNLPTSLDGVSVSVNSKAAMVWYISGTQLNVIAPNDATTGPVQVTVTNATGATASMTANLQTYSPGFYVLGSSPYAAAVHTDGVLVAPVNYFGAGYPSRPAKPGETILLYGNGFGPTSPTVQVAQIFSGAAGLTNMSLLQVQIGGATANVSFAGIVTNGEYQLNTVVPSLPDGDQALSASIGGVSTSGLMISVKN